MTTVRIGDREREATVGALRTAYEAGCLDVAELEQRLDAAWAGRTQPELDALTADLPATAVRAASRPAHGQDEPRRTPTHGGDALARAHTVTSPTHSGDALARAHASTSPTDGGDAPARAHAATFLVVMAGLVAVWLLSGAGHPWPLWVALGWGPAALGGHRGPWHGGHRGPWHGGSCGWPAWRRVTR